MAEKFPDELRQVIPLGKKVWGVYMESSNMKGINFFIVSGLLKSVKINSFHPSSDEDSRFHYLDLNRPAVDTTRLLADIECQIIYEREDKTTTTLTLVGLFYHNKESAERYLEELLTKKGEPNV